MVDIPLDSVTQSPFTGTAGGFSWGTATLIIIVSIAVIVGIVLLAIKVRRIFGRPELRGLTRERIRSQWDEIEKLSLSGSMGAKMAIVEADKLLDGILKSMAMPGTTLGERLKFAGYKYTELRNVWPAHRLRNQIVHESTFDIGEHRARAALKDYEKAIRSLGLL